MSLLRNSRPRGRSRLLRGVALATAIAAAGALGACSAGSSNNTTATGTVSFFSWDAKPTMAPLMAEFEKANPKIKIEFSTAPPVQQYISTLQTRLSSGTAADVFIITAENKVDIMNSKAALNLNGEPFVSNLATAAKQTYTKGGKLYGAATSSWGGGIMYNKDLLAKVGATAPPKTWSEFLALCKKLKDAGIQPFYEGEDGIPVSVAALVGEQSGASTGEMDAKIWSGKTTFAKTWTKPLEKWVKLFDQGLEPRSVAGLTGTNAQTEFTSGRVAMLGTGSWALGGIQSAAPKLNLGFSGIPAATAPYWAGAVSPGYAINAKTKNKAAAEKWVSFLVSKQGVGEYQKLTGSIMTTKNFTPKLSPVLSSAVTDIRAGKFYLPQVTWPDNSAAMNTYVVSILQQLTQGQIKPAQATASMDAKLKSLQG
jgi:raffinose/stachyose/melibiose transport system substrate-binding protein